MAADDPKTYSELVALWPAMPAHAEPIEFEDDDVPQALRELIPYALIWGIPDDGYRSDMLQETPAFLRAHMRAVVMRNERDLEGWLANEGSQGAARTSAFDAFVALLMAADAVSA